MVQQERPQFTCVRQVNNFPQEVTRSAVAGWRIGAFGHGRMKLVSNNFRRVLNLTRM